MKTFCIPPILYIEAPIRVNEILISELLSANSLEMVDVLPPVLVSCAPLPARQGVDSSELLHIPAQLLLLQPALLLDNKYSGFMAVCNFDVSI